MRLYAAAALILLAGCAGTATSPEARCSQLVPANWADGVEGADIPADDDVTTWQRAFVAQSGQLEKANGRTADAMAITSRCETMINETRRKQGIFG